MSIAPNPEKKPARRPQAIEANSDLALIAMPDIVALTSASRSWIHQAVADGRFPKPAFSQRRFTRWRLASVRAWIAAAGQDGAAV